MSYVFDSRLGAQLYGLLPGVYRNRDKHSDPAQPGSGSEDLARYLDAHGHLLDRIHATLQQQLKDTLPDSSQDWLLSYFAQLLAANMVSPDSVGRHAEVAHAVSWRQRKGTLKCAEEIGEAVGQMEVELQEGWQRVALTPRIDKPVIPFKAWDNSLEIDMNNPFDAIRHPGLPVAMVDLRNNSRTLESVFTNPATRTSSFAGVKQSWRQHNRHGAPCFPASYEDTSRRTVDMRSTNWQHGHYHPKRLLAFVPPAPGLFGYASIKLNWADRLDSRYQYLIEEKLEKGVWVIRNKSERVVEITDEVTLSPVRPYRIEGLNFSNKISVVDGASLELYRVEALEAQVDTFSTDEPVLIAEHCLFGELSVGSGLAKLDSCTVIDKAILRYIEALDCLFTIIEGSEISGTLQYSRYPLDAPFDAEAVTLQNCSHDAAAFFSSEPGLAARSVLPPNTSPGIYAGASDGGEMGYFHLGRQSRPVKITGDYAILLSAENTMPVSDLVFEGIVEVEGGVLHLQRSACKSLTVKTSIDEVASSPVLDAQDCLFDHVVVASGLARLEYCTVMQSISCLHLQASDCLFVGTISGGDEAEPLSGCVRFSRIPQSFNGSAVNVRSGFSNSNTRQQAIFINTKQCSDDGSEMLFGDSGYGVLHTATPDAIRFGAEDGGELGIGHHKFYSLKAAAVLEKLHEFLPVGIEPVLIQDKRLWQMPPQATS